MLKNSAEKFYSDTPGPPVSADVPGRDGRPEEGTAARVPGRCDRGEGSRETEEPEGVPAPVDREAP